MLLTTTIIKHDVLVCLKVRLSRSLLAARKHTATTYVRAADCDTTCGAKTRYTQTHTYIYTDTRTLNTVHNHCRPVWAGSIPSPRVTMSAKMMTAKVMQMRRRWSGFRTPWVSMTSSTWHDDTDQWNVCCVQRPITIRATSCSASTKTRKSNTRKPCATCMRNSPNSRR